MQHDKFNELDKVHKLLVEMECGDLIAPMAIGQTVMQMIHDLHNDKEQFGAHLVVPSPDGKYNFVIRIFREDDMLVATDGDD